MLPFSLRMQQKKGAGGHKNPKYGLICGVPAALTNKYSGSGGALGISSNNGDKCYFLSKRNIADDGKVLFYKDFQVDGSASFNTIYSSINDRI